MNRLDTVLEILDGSSNRLKERYFEKNYNDVYTNIIEFCEKLELPFKQKLWHWVNNNPNYYTCSCGESTTFNRNWLDGYRLSCSSKCAQIKDSTKEKRKKTTLKKYGVDNIAKLDSTKNKQEETNLDKYGTKSSFQNENVKNKWKLTVLDKHGTDHYFKTKEFKIKTEKTNLEKYGKKHFTQTDLYLEKTKNSNLEKYGHKWYTQSEEYKKVYKETSLERYGVDHPLKNKDIRNKIKIGNLKRYGVDSYLKTDEFKNKSKESNLKKYGVDHYSKTKYWKERFGLKEFKDRNIENRKKFYKKKGFEFVSSVDNSNDVLLYNDLCGHEFEIHPTNLQRRQLYNITVCTKCNPISSKQSGQEIKVLEWLSSIIDIEIESQNKKIIPPYELDIFIPNKGLAIEYNGLHWHSEVYKDKEYHLNKMLLCNKLNIDLLQIWEDDWLYRQNIVKSVIMSRLGIIDRKLWARKCDIKFINDKKLVDDFFIKNHLQGRTTYKYSIGLFYQDELVSCMLFNKPKSDFELVRFVNKINYVVVGSASRLFNFFIKNIEIDRIISFADRSVFTGNLYNMLGFEFEHRTSPNYWWVIGDARKHRFNYNKKKLVKNGGDPNKTEVQIMHELGNYRIWGCGLDKWIWYRK